MADATDLKSVVRKDVRVRLPPSAPLESKAYERFTNLILNSRYGVEFQRFSKRKLSVNSSSAGRFKHPSSSPHPMMLTPSSCQLPLPNSVRIQQEGKRVKLTRDIKSLSTFKRHTAKVVRQLKQTGQPVVLTVNGKAELVVQDAESYQKLLEAKERMEAIEGIKRGLESLKRNARKPAEKFFKEFFTEKVISERE
jgi:prevent-host-death family protein